MTARLGMVLGLLLNFAVGAWWLFATRVALGSGGATAPLAAQALFVLGAARPMLVGIVGLRMAALGGFGDGARTALPVVVAAWPLVALAWLASTASLGYALTVEAVLLAYAMFVALLGHGLGRITRRGRWTMPLATILGIALASGAWLLSGLWRPAIGG
jgi:hypothetical protein